MRLSAIYLSSILAARGRKAPHIGPVCTGEQNEQVGAVGGKLVCSIKKVGCPWFLWEEGFGLSEFQGVGGN